MNRILIIGLDGATFDVYSIRHKGTHRLNGIFVDNGSQIKKGKNYKM